MKAIRPLMVATLVVMVTVAMLAAWLPASHELPVAHADTTVDYGWLKIEEWGASSSGTEGSATMSATSDGYVRGHVYGVYLDWATGVTATSDITLTATNPPVTVLYKADSATDGWFYPAVAQSKTSDGSALTTYDRVPVNSRITADVGETSLITTSNVVTVTLYWGQ